MVDNRVTFGSKLGVILATVGCAVGLGSIWRFPYMLGTNGGAAFLLIYILFMIFLGIPVMVTEFFIGRYSRSNTVGSFKKMAPGTKWCWIGYNGILAAFLILGFYAVVSGWTLEYVWQTVNGSLYSTPGVDFTAGFDNFSSNALRPIFWTAVFIGLTHFVIASGVEKGIERASKIMMPLLFFILVVMCVRSVTLPKCRSGTGVPVQTGFQQADFIRCTECRRAGVLFAESRHGLPYHLLFLFRERHQHVGNSLAGDDHQYFCGSPGRDHDLPGSLQLRDYPIGRRPTGIHHFAQRIRAVTVQQLVVAYFLYLAGDGGTDFYHFLA